jgi:hypothetical protein
MEFDKVLDKKIKRNKFFVTAGAFAAGYVVMKTFPFSLIFKNKSARKDVVAVKLNPYAVSRNKTGAGNVR